MSDTEKLAELKAYFEKRMEDSRKTWAARGPEARKAALEARLANPNSWRNMRGMKLFMHEVSHPGNRPFAIGFATLAVGVLYIQTTFSDEAKANSDYYQMYHAKK